MSKASLFHRPCQIHKLAWLAAALVIAALLLQPRPTGAAGETITIAPTSGPVGTLVTVSSATTFGAGSTVTLTYDGAAITQVGGAPIVASGTGAFTAPIQIPASTAGVHPIVATGPGGASPAVNFTVTNNFTLSVNSGTQGIVVAVTGTGFGASQTSIAINFNGVQVASATASLVGSFSSSFVVPTLTAGFYNVTVGSAPALQFQITSNLSVNPTAGPVGSTVNVLGSSFAASGTINLTFNGVPVRTAASDASGAFSTSFQVPATPAGARTVNVSGSSGPGATFTVNPAITLSPAAAPPGGLVTVNGTGFAAGEGNIIITFSATIVAQNIVADSNGSWTGTFTVPSGTSGTQQVRAYGGVTTAPTVPPVSLSLSAGIRMDLASGTPGTSVRVSGFGFPTNQGGIILSAQGAQNVTVAADERGTFSAAFVIPQAPSGQLTIRATPPNQQPTDVTFTVGPGVTLGSNSGAPGSSLTVQGSGFPASQGGITVTLGRATTTVTSTALGSWSASLTVPSMAGGAYPVRTGGTGAALESIYTVLPVITLSRTGGAVGDSITVSGAGFNANAAGITLSFGQTSVASGVSANADGSWSANVIVPSAPSGSYPIRTGGATQGIEASFMLTPSVILAGDRIAPGASLAVSGRGFAANERGIVVSLGDGLLTSGINANAEGAWSVTVTAPALPSGSYKLQVSGPSSPATVVSLPTLTIGAGLVPTPQRGTPGSSVTVAGTGFSGGERNIVVTFDGMPLASGLTADTTGGFTASFIVPAAAGGPHSIKATGANTGSNNSPEGIFQVTPIIAASRASGAPGVAITVAGSGFRASETGIVLSFNGAPVLQSVRADAQGSFSVSFTPPAASAGTYLIQASGAQTLGDARPELSFTLTPGLVLSAVAGPLGGSLDVSGAGFAPNSPVTVTFDGGASRVTVGTDASGSFRAALPLPPSTRGDHPIVVQDGRGASAQALYTVEGTAPGSVKLLGPENSSGGARFGGYQPTFTWGPAEDPSGVTYTLQVAKTADFSAPVFTKSDIETPAYTMSGADKLPRGSYFWRVRAIDRASNEGAWSAPYTLKSGTMSYATPVILILLILAALGAAFYFLRKRRAPPQPIGVGLPGTVPGFDPGMRVSLPTGQRPSLPSAASGAPVPPRFALPTGRRGRTPSHEDLAYANQVADFLQSVPLLQTGADLEWFEELIAAAGGAGVAAREEALAGRLEVRYQPAWANHPTFSDMRQRLQGHPVLDGLLNYIAGVDSAVADGVSLLGAVQADLLAELRGGVSPEQRWPLTLSVGQDALAWYRGTFLREPSARDYVVTVDGGDGNATLAGTESTPIRGLTLGGLEVAEAERYRDTHLKVRNSYRNNAQAQQLAAKLGQLDTMREQLAHAIAQLRS